MPKPRLAKDSPAEGSRGVIERELQRADAKGQKAKPAKKPAPKSPAKP